MITVEAEKVRIAVVSPCPKNSLPFIWEWLNHFSRETLDARSPKTFEDLVAKEERDRENGSLSFAVLADGKMVGGVWYEAIGDGMSVGHLVFDPGHTISTAEKLTAVRQTIKETFEAGFRKIIWQFFADNRPFEVFMKRLGAEREGLFRQYARRGNEWVDAVFMASFPEGK